MKMVGVWTPNVTEPRLRGDRALSEDVLGLSLSVLTTIVVERGEWEVLGHSLAERPHVDMLYTVSRQGSVIRQFTTPCQCCHQGCDALH